MESKDLISLGELAKELKINKSTLAYYSQLGVIIPITTIGRMQLFNKNKILKRLKEVKAEQKKGKTLKEIANN